MPDMLLYTISIFFCILKYLQCNFQTTTHFVCWSKGEGMNKGKKCIFT